jgi:hypothetical protein
MPDDRTSDASSESTERPGKGRSHSQGARRMKFHVTRLALTASSVAALAITLGAGKKWR